MVHPEEHVLKYLEEHSLEGLGNKTGKHAFRWAVPDINVILLQPVLNSLDMLLVVDEDR